MRTVNLDHLSANPILPEVQEAMIDAVRGNYGNPSSQHSIGEQAAETLEKSRESVARLINAAVPREVVFTSGGTESVNHAV
ncbi:MAG: aminotransferase class V-fold PLP-dependent enzyme [Deltaproteobacteria bacterium]|nr:aminotransferase class V-fold PLP-dependent enzyme [Deltaproteobacteria bacterium]